MTTLDAHKLAAARLWAASRLPYLASAVFATQVRARPGCGTVAVDQGWQVAADPAVVDGLDVPGLGRLLVHLTCHVRRDHAGRARRLGPPSDLDADRWNRCADAEVNDDLRAADCVPTAAPELPADLGCAEHQLAETYYADAGAGPREWGCGSGADGVGRAWDGDSGLDAQQAELLRVGVAADLQR